MNNLTFFAALICLITMVEMSSSQVFKRDITIPINPMTRKLTRKELRNLKPKLDGIPRGKKKPHPLTGRVSNRKPAIIGGKPAITNQFPWMVAILSNGVSFCGGSVISPTWVLTAAHCIIGSPSMQLLMGTVSWKSPIGRVLFTSNISIVHEDYQSATVFSDIGLVKLQVPISTTLIRSGKIVPIRLPRQDQATTTFEGVVMTVSGWGLTTNAGSVTSTLNFVSLPVISNADCASSYGTIIITSSIICTSPGSATVATSICSGDSGSGLHVKEADGVITQFGIVSFNAYATCFGLPAGFTRVSSFLAWISLKTGLVIQP